MLNEDERRGREEGNKKTGLGLGARALGPSKTPVCTDHPRKAPLSLLVPICFRQLGSEADWDVPHPAVSSTVWHRLSQDACLELPSPPSQSLPMPLSPFLATSCFLPL